MKINTKATNITITETISHYLDKRLGSLRKFIDEKDEAVMLDVELGKTTRHHEKGDIFRAEFNLHMTGKSLRAVSESSDLYTAIDEAKDELCAELRSHKTKRLHLLRRGGQKIKEMLRGFYRKKK